MAFIKKGSPSTILKVVEVIKKEGKQEIEVVQAKPEPEPKKKVGGE